MVILLASGLIIPPLLLASLGKEGYGVWLLVGQVTAYLPILDLGVSSSVGRFVAKYNAKEDYESLSRIISSSLFLFLMSSIGVIIITLILWPNFSKFFHLSREYFNTGRWLIMLIGLGLAVDFPLRIGQGILQGIHRFDLMYLLRATGTFLRLILIIAVFGWFRSRSLIVLGIIATAITILIDVLMCSYVSRKSPFIVKFEYKSVKFSSLREIWSLSLSALLGTLAALLFNQGQIISVGKIIGTETVTIYAIPIMLLTYGSMVTAYITGAFKPMASHMQALNEKKKLQKLNIGGVKISFIISLFIAVIAIAFGHPFFKIWLHASKDLSSADFAMLSNILTIMVVGFAVGVPQNVSTKMLSGIDKQWFVAFVSLAASIVGFCLGILLMLKTNLGLYGMAVGWATVFFVKGVLVFPIKACHHFNISPLHYIKQAYLPPLIAGGILIVIIFLIKKVLDSSSFISLFPSILLCMIVYAISVYFFCLSQEEKMRLWNIVGLSKINAS
jgi:O-antigen/teichoic acid export membrane protein